MSVLEAIQNYFQAEKQLGMGLSVFGLVLLGIVFWVARTQAGGFAWGLAVPLAVAGLAFGGGGVFLAIRSDKQITEYTAQLEQTPDVFFQAETARMERVNANWSRIKIVWTVVMVAALVLLHLVRKEWATGLALAFLLLMTTLLFTDVFAERRAIVYTKALEHARAAARVAY